MITKADINLKISKLNAVKRASFEHSLSWKKNSAILLKNSVTLSEFRDAVKWCGTNGNVARSVPKKQFKKYSKFIYDNKSEILNGSFDLNSTQSYGKGRPLSWTSKICHILNPRDYPLIYDEKIRSKNHLKNIVEFQSYVDLLKANEFNSTLSTNELYEYDSAEWASK